VVVKVLDGDLPGAAFFSRAAVRRSEMPA